MVRAEGIRWVATDEEILHASLRRSGLLREGEPFLPERKYLPYRFGDDADPIHIFFRDHLLSDMIGFTYSTYDGESAADDLVSRLLLVRKLLPDDARRFAVPIILDGENAWEHYPDNGMPFLRALYERLERSPFLKAVTFSEYLGLGEATPALPKVRAGSWIFGSFSTWVGHPEKNRGWDLLAATRKKLAEVSLTLSPDDAVRRRDFQKALEHVMVAEGSDWFWWYGEDHFSEYDREFDQLFRAHLDKAWRQLGLQPPDELAVPIIQKVSRFKVQRPFELLSPVLDGFITDYFEWLAAGYFSNQYAFTTMQQVHKIFNGFHFGFDHHNLYVRLDVENAILNDKKYPFRVEIHFRKPGDIFYRMVGNNRRKKLVYEQVAVDERGAEAARRPCELVGVRQIVELGVPWPISGSTRTRWSSSRSRSSSVTTWLSGCPIRASWPRRSPSTISRNTTGWSRGRRAAGPADPRRPPPPAGGQFRARAGRVVPAGLPPLPRHLPQFPSLRMVWHCSGFLFQWLAARHPDYLDQLTRLVAAGRVEPLPGGMYEPIFPVIPPADRAEQLRRLTELVADRFGCTRPGASGWRSGSGNPAWSRTWPRRAFATCRWTTTSSTPPA